MRLNRQWTYAAMALGLVWSSGAYAEKFYWKSLLGNLGLQKFDTAEQACVATYQYVAAAATTYQLFPYKPPYPIPPVVPNYVFMNCHIEGVYTTQDGGSFVNDIPLMRFGDGCEDSQKYNPVTGKCQAPTEDQEDKELGDPDRKASQGVVVCGNPVNIGAGNKFQKEVDYVDKSGYLRFERYFNGMDGQWRHNYQSALYKSANDLAVVLSDGETILFTFDGTKAVAETEGVGSLIRSGDSWVYTDPSDQSFTYDAEGKLISIIDEKRNVTSLTYLEIDSDNTMITVADMKGHSIVITESPLHDLKSMTTGGLVVSYARDSLQRLASAKRSWANHSVTRAYVYDDSRNPLWLTGLVDERGVRYATWTYDDQGRAITSEHAGGAEKVTMTYETDGSVTVTNALGHKAHYRYQVIQGLKRIVAVDGEPAAGCPASNTQYTYTTGGQIATRTDALGHVTSFAYDALGREIQKTEAKGLPQERVTATAWDGNSFRPATVTTPDQVTTYTYDAQGRRLTKTTHSTKD